MVLLCGRARCWHGASGAAAAARGANTGLRVAVSTGSAIVWTMVLATYSAVYSFCYYTTAIAAATAARSWMPAVGGALHATSCS